MTKLFLSTDDIKIEGYLFDKDNKTPLEFANIGVIGQPIGAITDKNGYFSLSLAQSMISEKLCFSFLGYESQTIVIKDFKNASSVYLKKGIYSLKEVIINKIRGESLTIGSKSTSKNLVTGWSNGAGTGDERGILIKNKNKKYVIKKINFHVAANSYDSLYVRVHIRKLINKMPATELLNSNVLIPVKIRSGWVSKDISDYNIEFDEPIVISLEWVYHFDTKKPIKEFYISSAILRGTLFAKRASADNWIVKKMFCPSIYIDVDEIEKK